MSKLGGLVCPACGAELEVQVWFDGCDWDSEAGEGSGFDYPIHLECTACPRIYPIGRLKREEDFSKEKEANCTYQGLSRM